MNDNFIPLCVPYLTSDDSAAVAEAVTSGWVSSAGPDINKFEDQFKKIFNFSNVTACSSGTSALHLALDVSGVLPGDEVIIPDITFVATANSIKYASANPIILDVDNDTLGLCPQALNNFINDHCTHEDGCLVNTTTKNRIAAVMPVHMLGTPAKLDEISEICKRYNLTIIEDATEALGSIYKNQYIGTHGNISCFSFNGNKMITTGGGGLVVSKNQQEIENAKHLATTAKTDPVFFEHDRVGYNYRLTNLQASLGVSQLNKFRYILDAKKNIHNFYKESFKDCEEFQLHIDNNKEIATSNHWLNAITLSDETVNRVNVKSFIDQMHEVGIQTRPLWTRISKLPMYSGNKFDPLSKSKRIHEATICLPSSVGLTDEQLQKVCENVKKLCLK